MVIDELLCHPALIRYQCAIGDVQCSPIMAFADDLVVLVDKHQDTEALLLLISRFMMNRGMSLNASKSVAVSTMKVNGSIIPSNRKFTIDGKPIQTVNELNTFRYLGHEFSTGGVLRPSLANLPAWLANVKKAPLKPDQKLIILRQYLLPRLFHVLQSPKITADILSNADTQIRMFVRAVLHLNCHTADAMIHARVADGGLGVQSLRLCIPEIFLRRLEKLSHIEEDATLSAVFSTNRVRSLIAKLRELAPDSSSKQLLRERISLAPFSKGLQMCSEDVASRAWLNATPHGWSGRDFVRAVQLRTANLPTMGIPSNPPEMQGCRFRCDAVESISHVLQGCGQTQEARIRRHNHVVKRISDHCHHTGLLVENEPNVRHANGTLDKPDLAIHLNDDRTVICDVQVSWDSEDMTRIWNEKRLRYENPDFIRAAARFWPGRRLIFAPVILGARGIWPKCNQRAVDLLGIPASVRVSCVNVVLKWGSSLHDVFMRSVRERARPGERYQRRIAPRVDQRRAQQRAQHL